MKLRKNENLQLAGWFFESQRTLAKLRHSDKSITYIDVGSLVGSTECMAVLNAADQDEVREMALQVAA